MRAHGGRGVSKRYGAEMAWVDRSGCAIVGLGKRSGGRDAGKFSARGRGLIAPCQIKFGAGRAKRLCGEVLRTLNVGTGKLVQYQRRIARLGEIEGVGNIVDDQVAAVQRGQAKTLFDELQYGRRFRLHVADVAGDGERRDDKYGSARSQAIHIFVGRRDVIVEAAKVIPVHDDQRGLVNPILLGIHDRVNDLHGPVLAEASADGRMFVAAEGDQPRNGRQLAGSDVRNELSIGLVGLVPDRGVVVDVIDGVVSVVCDVGWSVGLPAHTRGGEQIA